MSGQQRPFADRREAGRRLAGRLAGQADEDVVVLGLPRGGVPVAAEVADRLGAALDVLVVRKLGLPGRPELAMGAVAAVGDAVETVRNPVVIEHAHVGEDTFEEVRRREVAELQRRAAAFRRESAAVPVRGRAVVVADDGLATGSTMRAAVAALRGQRPRRVTVAVPVGSRSAVEQLSREVDEVVCLWTPEPFSAVGQAYLDFAPTGDDEVRNALSAANRRTRATGRNPG
jgi:predicted phosphoribosyltransferase